MSDLDIQATWIGVFLDVAEVRVTLENDAKRQGLRWYGDQKIDDLQDATRYAPRLQAIFDQYQRKPESWTRLLAYLTNCVVFAGDEKTLRRNLLKITAFTVAWVEDIDRRAVPGYKGR